MAKFGFECWMFGEILTVDIEKRVLCIPIFNHLIVPYLRAKTVKNLIVVDRYAIW